MARRLPVGLKHKPITLRRFSPEYLETHGLRGITRWYVHKRQLRELKKRAPS